MSDLASHFQAKYLDFSIYLLGARSAQAIVSEAMSTLTSMVKDRLSGKKSGGSSGGSKSGGSGGSKVRTTSCLTM